MHNPAYVRGEASDRNKSPDSCYLGLITLISKTIFFDIENPRNDAKSKSVVTLPTREEHMVRSLKFWTRKRDQTKEAYEGCLNKMGAYTVRLLRWRSKLAHSKFL